MGRRTARRTPARAALSDRTEPEIADRLYVSSRLTDKHTEIETLARHVFGSGQVASPAPKGITEAWSVCGCGQCAGGQARRHGRPRRDMGSPTEP